MSEQPTPGQLRLHLASGQHGCMSFPERTSADLLEYAHEYDHEHRLAYGGHQHDEGWAAISLFDKEIDAWLSKADAAVVAAEQLCGEAVKDREDIRAAVNAASDVLTQARNQARIFEDVLPFMDVSKRLSYLRSLLS